MQDAEYFAIKSRAAKELFKIPGVTCVAMGGRSRNGQPTGEIVIKVFVERKMPAADVPREQMIPASFEGVPTDVVEMGPIRPSLDPVPGVIAPAPGTAHDMTGTDPLQGGVIIVTFEPQPPAQHHTGTLGCFLRDKQDGTAVYALTNAHVVDDDERRVSFSRRMLRTDTGGVLDDIHPLGYVSAFISDCVVDAAVVRLETGREWIPAIKDIGFVIDTFEVTLAEAVTELYQVRKRGYRTGLTGGVVVAVGAQHSPVGGAHERDLIIRPNDALAPNQDKQTYFGAHGDSGSVVVNDDNEIVALYWGSNDIEKTPLVKKSHGAAIPIDAILDRFKRVHHLDLEVAIAQSSTPTEASEKQRVLPPAGAPRLPPSELIKRSDQGHRRPLVGGSQIIAEPFGASNAGALGCIVNSPSDPDTAYILTSLSAVSNNSAILPTTDTDVGQPDNEGSCSQCCDNTVGEFFKGGAADGMPTSAIVKLEDDQRWLAEVMQIGLLRGTATVLAPQLNPPTYQVRKRGPGSRLTGGVVTAIGGLGGTLPPGVRPDAMIIRPNPNPLKPGEDICFSRSNDRGAVIVGEDNRVVGLLYDEVEIIEGGVRIVHGVATPIDDVMNELQALPGMQGLTLATATKPDQVKTTNSRVITALDTTLPPIPVAHPIALDRDVNASSPAWTFDWLRGELSHSAAGRLMTSIWTEHRGEVRYLIDHNRRVATVWHRSGGPALLQALFRLWQDPTARMPATVNGMPLAICVDRIARAFSLHASGSLRNEMAALTSILPPLAGRSLDEILSAFEGLRQQRPG